MLHVVRLYAAVLVALLAEGVDRNDVVGCVVRSFDVALLAEGVDRNFFIPCRLLWNHCRPPRGGRG